MKKIVSFVFIISTLLLFHSSILTQVSAKKKIVRSQSSKTVVRGGGSRVIITPKIRKDRKALIINFSNLGVVSSLTYELSYFGSSVPQGVAGTITSSGKNSIQRELLFGTCSKTVCRYHTGIKNMTFVVTSTLKSGSKVRKTFRIRV